MQDVIIYIKKDKEALKIIDIIESTNTSVELLSLKASIYADQDKSKEALIIYNALIAKVDISLLLRLGRAIANTDLKMHQESINDLTYIINKQPSSKIYNYRAEIKYGLSDIKGTFDDYKKSAEKGDSIAILNIRGMYKKYPEAKNW
ncbi:MAG: hypothetical protein H0U95_12520 [Bacteroidetes bacterium]|nr:hypothetical protein [Bacteroidota bacterium]